MTFLTISGFSSAVTLEACCKEVGKEVCFEIAIQLLWNSCSPFKTYWGAHPDISQLSSDAQAGWREEGSEGKCPSAMANAVDIACEQRRLIFAVKESRLFVCSVQKWGWPHLMSS